MSITFFKDDIEDRFKRTLYYGVDRQRLQSRDDVHSRRTQAQISHENLRA